MKKSDKKSSFWTTEGTPYEVPVEGSLGLLALGYRGIMAWRVKRKEMNLPISNHSLEQGGNRISNTE